MRQQVPTLWSITHGHRLRYALATAALVGATAFAYTAPLVTGAVIDGVLGGEASAEGSSAVSSSLASWFRAWQVEASDLWIAAVAILLVNALAGSFAYFKGRWSAQAAESIAREIRDWLYERLHQVPMSFHHRSDTGDLVQRCSSDVETVRTFLADQVVQVGRTVVMLVIAVPVMLALDVRLTLWATCLFPPIFLFAILFFRRVKEVFLEADEAEGRMTTVLQENLTGIRVVRAFGRQEFERDKFGVASGEFRDLSYRVIRLMGIYWASSDILCLGQIGVVLVVGAHGIQQGIVSVGTAFAFLNLVTLLIFPFRHLGRVLTDTGKAVVAMGRIGEVLGEEPERDIARPVEPPADVLGEIVLRNVTFAHVPGGTAALSDVSLRVTAGETVALLGPPGSGKTTIVELLLRLHDYEDGSITLDGHELRDLPRRWVRRTVAAVLQEPFLYSRTLAENIRVGRAEAHHHELEEAATVACIHDTIQSFPEGYETLVGERGVTLSGGQRQRVAIARAVLEEAPVLLLDDALSAVDTHTEAHIRDALVARRGRRSTIVIAHRLSTVARADRVVVLDKGRVVQDGPPSELAAVDGAYRRLARLQAALESEIDSDLRTLASGG